MRDYVKVFTLIIYDDPVTSPPAMAFFDSDQNVDAQGWFSIYEPFYTNPIKFAEYRWYGFDKQGIIDVMNVAYSLSANIGLFLAGTDSPPIFTESPRRKGFNSQTEKNRRRSR